MMSAFQTATVSAASENAPTLAIRNGWLFHVVLGILVLTFGTAWHHAQSQERQVSPLYNRADIHPLSREAWKEIEAEEEFPNVLALFLDDVENSHNSANIQASLLSLEASKIELLDWTRARISCLLTSLEARRRLNGEAVDFNSKAILHRIDENLQRYDRQGMPPLPAWHDDSPEGQKQLAEGRAARAFERSLCFLRIDLHRVIKQKNNLQHEVREQSLSKEARAIIDHDLSFTSDLELYDLITDQWKTRVFRQQHGTDLPKERAAPTRD